MTTTVNITLKAGGKDLSRDLAQALISLDCNYDANGIPEATVIFNESKLASNEFDAADTAELEPGKPIELLISRIDKKKDEKHIFSGVITGHSLRIKDSGAQFILHCHSALICLVEPRLTQVFKEKTDDAKVLKDLIAPSKVTAQIKGGKIKHEQLAIYDQHAWDFIKYRVEANGMLLMPWINKQGKELLTIQAPNAFKTKAIELTLGLSPILELDLSLDTTNALDKLKTAAWDAAKQANDKGQASKTPASGMKITSGPITAAKAAKGLARSAEWLPIRGTGLTPPELQGWSASEVLYRELDRYQGQITLQGRHDIHPGGHIKLVKLSKNFTGEFLVTGVRHKVGPGDWTTTVRIGLPITRTSFFKGLHKQHSTVRSILVGKALGYGKADSGKLNRIQVEVPALGNAKLWARPGSPYASKDACFFFPPAKGDEVILGWMEGSACEPVILGSLYNADNKPADKYHDDNMKRTLLLTKDDKLEFDAKGKTLSLIHQKHSLTLAEKEVTLDAAEPLTLKTAKNMAIEPGKDLAIKAGSPGVTIEASMVEIK